MSNKILNKVNNDIFSYDTTGGVFKMSRVMPTEIHHSTAGVGTSGYILTSTGNGWSWTDPATLSSGSSLTDVNVTSPSTGEILAYDGSNWINSGNIKSLTGILNSTNYNYINITDTTPATVTVDYNDGSITDRHASLIVEGGVIVKAGPTSGDTVGSNPRVYSFISEGEGFFRGGLELENGMTLFSGDITDIAYGNIYQRGVKIGNTNLDLEGKSLTLSNNGNGLFFQSGSNPINICNINASGDGVNGGIIEMFTKDINGNLTKKISINSTGSVGFGTSPSYGNSGDVLTSQGGGAPPIWSPATNDLSGLTDTSLSNPQNGDILEYDSTTQVWKNVTPSGGSGGTTVVQNNTALVSNLPQTYAGPSCITLGYLANYSNLQSINSIAIGTYAQGSGSAEGAISIGHQSGGQMNYAPAPLRSVAIGFQAGRGGHGTNGTDSIDIGYFAGGHSTTENCISIGFLAGNNTQGVNAIAMGYSAGQLHQGDNSIAIGYKASQSNQSPHVDRYIVLNAQTTELNPDNNDAFYVKPIRSSTNDNKLLYNSTTGEITYQPDAGGGGGTSIVQNNTALVSNLSGSNAGPSSITLGAYAGNSSYQSTLSIAIGQEAQYSGSGEGAISIGYQSGGKWNYGPAPLRSISIGYRAGRAWTGTDSIDIGHAAGNTSSSDNCVSIGTLAGNNTQGVGAIAIGTQAGQLHQGDNSIAIGYKASLNNTTNNVDRYIVLNAQTTELNPDNNDAFYVKPIRSSTNDNKLLYNSTTGEITYQPDAGGGGGSASYVYYGIVASVFPANSSFQVFGKNVTVSGGANVPSVSLLSSNNATWFNAFDPTTGAFSFNTEGVYRLKFEIQLVKSWTPPDPAGYGNFLLLEQTTTPFSVAPVRRVFTYAIGHYVNNAIDTFMSPQLHLEHILVVNAGLLNQPFIASVWANGANYYIESYVNSSMCIIEKIG